ncbi:MAG: hypothetical protein K2M75_05320 [Clostridia bacterium]|nr:hypothetical protein [Clostridia bacterium]
MQYYKVSAKCGHVGRNNYIIKNFYIKANNGKEAAYKVRYTPRVKHDRKDAILAVDIITKEEYTLGKKIQAKDTYFKVNSSSEQRRHGAVDYALILPEKKAVKRQKCKKNSIYYHKLARIMRRDTQQQLSGVV